MSEREAPAEDEQPRVVAPLSAVTERQLARSLPSASIASLRLLQRHLLHERCSSLAPLISTTSAAAPHSVSAQLNGAAITMQTAARARLGRLYLYHTRRSACRLQRWARRRSKRGEPAQLASLRLQLASMLLITAGFSVLRMAMSSLVADVPFSPKMDGASVLLLAGMLLSAAATARRAVCGRHVPEWLGVCLVTVALMLKLRGVARALSAAAAATTDDPATLVALSAFMTRRENAEELCFYGVIHGLLASPRRLRGLCTASVVLALAVVGWAASTLGIEGISPLHVVAAPLIFLTSAAGSAALTQAALEHTTQFEKTLGDLRQALDRKSRAFDPVDEEALHEAWRSGPLLRTNLLVSQIALLSISISYHLGNTSWGAYEVLIVNSLRGVVMMGVRLVLALTVPPCIGLWWAKIMVFAIMLLPLLMPLTSIARSVQQRLPHHVMDSPPLQPACLVTNRIAECPIETPSAGCITRLPDLGQLPEFVLTSILMVAFMTATSPVPVKMRLTAVLAAVCADVIAIVTSMDAVSAMNRVMIRTGLTLWGFILASVFVHQILASAWKRSQLLSRLETRRMESLLRWTTAAIRRELLRPTVEPHVEWSARASLKAWPLEKWYETRADLAMDMSMAAARAPRPPAQLSFTEASEGAVLFGVRQASFAAEGQGQQPSRMLGDQHQHAQLASSRFSRSSRSSRSFRSSRSSRSMDCIPTIPEDNCFAMDDDDDYILDDDSKFCFDAEGFLVPR